MVKWKKLKDPETGDIITYSVADIPTTADAEKWLDADRFIYKGKVWVVRDNKVEEDKNDD